MNDRNDVEAPVNVRDIAPDELDSTGQQAVAAQEWVDAHAMSPKPRKAQRTKESSGATSNIEEA